METRRFTLAENVIVDFPLDDEIRRILSSLGAFRAHLQAEFPDILERFETEFVRVMTKQIPEPIARTVLHPSGGENGMDVVQRACVAYVLHLLGWIDEIDDIILEIDRTDGLRARLYPAFYRMRALRDVMGAEAAIPFLKDYIDRRIHEIVEPDESIEDVDRYWDEIDDPGFQSPTGGIAARFHRGKSAFRIDRCLWADLMEPLHDPQIAFLVCCYGDTASVEALSPHLAYTCPMTLVEGDPFCDKCIHDRRYVESVDHPSRSFYEELGPRAQARSAKA